MATIPVEVEKLTDEQAVSFLSVLDEKFDVEFFDDDLQDDDNESEPDVDSDNEDLNEDEEDFEEEINVLRQRTDLTPQEKLSFLVEVLDRSDAFGVFGVEGWRVDFGLSDR